MLERYTEVWSMHTYRTRANNGRGFFPRLIFLTLHNGAFQKLLSIFIICYCTKIQYNTPIFGDFFDAAIIQEHPLLAQVCATLPIGVNDGGKEKRKH